MRGTSQAPVSGGGGPWLNATQILQVLGTMYCITVRISWPQFEAVLIRYYFIIKCLECSMATIACSNYSNFMWLVSSVHSQACAA